MSDLTVKSSTELTVVPDYLKEAYISAGSSFAPEDLQIPSLVIAQDKSEALTEGEPGFIPGLNAGQFYNSASREIYGDTINVIFVKMAKSYVRYKDQEYLGALSEKEFLALPERTFNDRLGFLSPALPGENLKENWKYFLLLADYPAIPFIYLTVKPGGLKEAKAWNTRLQSLLARGYPDFAKVWELPVKLVKSNVQRGASSYQISGGSARELRDITAEESAKVQKIRQISQAEVLDADGDPY